MTNQSNSYLRLHDIYSFRTFSCFIIFSILFLQGPINVSAQVNQYESVIGLSNNNNNNNIRSSSTTSVASNSDDMNDEEIYDEDPEVLEESPTSSTLKSNLPNKPLPNTSTNVQIQPEEIPKGDYEEENDSYSNDDQIDNETTDNDDTSFSDDNDLIKHPEINSITNPEKNNRKDFEYSSTSKLPFGPANLWRDLFSQPGILVGIVGGVVIGMLAAILLVMFIIYRMRKKDEGSYALEEGPRKSPSHAYTRVSSREFFA